MSTYHDTIGYARYRVPHAALTLSRVLSTGIPTLDQCLPGGGWPLGGVIELVSALEDDAEPMDLLMPALTTLSWEDRWVMLIQPPALPPVLLERQLGFDLSRFLVVHERPGDDNALALAERAARTGNAAAVLVWPDRVSNNDYANLKEAAIANDSQIFLLRQLHTACTSSSSAKTQATLQLQLHKPSGQNLQVTISQCTGGQNTSLSFASDQTGTDFLDPQQTSPSNRATKPYYMDIARKAG